MTSSETALLAHGKNWELPIPSQPENIRLSIESQITATAAGLLYVAGMGDTIIFSTGHTAGPQYPSEAQAMRDYMRTQFSEEEIPGQAILLEDSSHDTLSNLQATQQLMAKNKINHVTLLTVGYHLPRVRYLAKQARLSVAGAYASDTVLQHLGHQKSHIYARRVLAQARTEHTVKPLIRTAASYALEAAGWSLAMTGQLGETLAKHGTAALRHQNTDN